MIAALLRFVVTLTLTLAPFSAFAQSVLQSGRVTPGHPAMWTTNGVIQDAGTSAAGSLTTLGITSSNLQSSCINNGPQTGPYSALCFGVGASGAQISLNSYDGAPPLSFTCIINGVSQPCFGGAGSFLPLTGGTLTGPLAINSTLNATGAATLNGGGGFAGNWLGTLNLTGAGTGLSITNNASIGGTLGVSGAVTFSGAFTALGMADVRSFGAICDGAVHSETTAAVNAAVAAAYRRVFLPQNCVYSPTADITPNDTTIVGENPATSIITSSNEVTTNVSLGARSAVENIGVVGFGCYNLHGTHNICPTPFANNVSDLPRILFTWPWEVVLQSGVSVTTPAGVTQTDIPLLAIEESAVGADGIYVGTFASGASGLRIVPSASAGGDQGVYILNGLIDIGSSGATEQHRGIFVKDFTNSGSSAGIFIDRVGNNTNVSNSLAITDTDAATSTLTSPLIALAAAHQPSGSLINVYGTTTPFNGQVILANMGNGGGAFTGSFVDLRTAGTPVFSVNYQGGVVASGGIVTSSVDYSGTLSLGTTSATAINIGNGSSTTTLSGLSVTPGSKQPVCIDTGTHRLYYGSGGTC